MSGADDDISYEGTLFESLGIRRVESSADRVVMELDVGPKVYQPMGLLHGGASAALAESAASLGAFLNCDPATQYVVGIELNISHLRARKSGLVRATATPARRGNLIQVWKVSLEDEDSNPVAVARCTLVVRFKEGLSDAKGV